MQSVWVRWILVLVMVLAGCAGPRGASLRDCALVAASAGVVAGAATGAIYDQSHDNSGEAAAVGAGVLAGTALIGLGACWLLAPERFQEHEAELESCDPCRSRHGARLAHAPEPVALPVAEPTPAPVAPNPCNIPVTLDGVRFDTDQHLIRPDAAAVLAGVADRIRSCPGKRMRVEAHTDSRGSDVYNQTLSELRARSVMDFLVSHGTDPDRLSFRGWGETRPADSNDTRQGRARNRRVELHPIDAR